MYCPFFCWNILWVYEFSSCTSLPVTERNMNFTHILCRYWPCQSSRSNPLLPFFLWRLLDKLWNRRWWSRGYSAVPRSSVHQHGRVHEDIFVMAKFENFLWVFLKISISMDTMCLNYFVLHYVLTTNTTSCIKLYCPEWYMDQ